MPGRAYTMREMKLIVDYLKDNKAYGETKGRKLWMEFANSKLTDRTWQSLKETFIKRILPDIHNPYYKLTTEEVCSFRQGFDVGARNKQKLEIHTIVDSSNSGDNKKEQPGTSKNNEESDTGEDIICSKIEERTRSSTETLVLRNCYENAEEIQRDLESPTKNNNNNNNKSFKDLITYSEPLTPMLQEVLHDFDTDDDEPRMQIVEENEPVDENSEENAKTTLNIRESVSFKNKTSSLSKDNEKISSNGQQEISEPLESCKIKSLKLKKTQKGTWENKDPPHMDNKESKAVETEITGTNKESGLKESVENSGKIDSKNDNLEIADRHSHSENYLSSATDTQLPNNQEELQKKLDTKTTSTQDSTTHLNKEHKKKSRKRERSQTSTEGQEKSKKNKKGAVSETQDKDKDTTSTLSSTHSSNNTSAGIENVKKVAEVEQKEQSKLENAKSDDQISRDKTDNDVEAGPSNVDKKQPPASEVNPCLKSVSLFEEQFTTSKYSDSENEKDKSNVTEVAAVVHEPPNENHNVGKNGSKESDKENHKMSSPKKDASSSKDIANIPIRKMDDIVLLKSHSESDDRPSQFPKPKVSLSLRRVKKSREKALANVFGFSSGYLWPACRKKEGSDNSNFGACGKTRVRSRQYSDSRHGRLRTNSKTASQINHESSDEYTTSESDSDERELRDRRDRHLKVYLKPEPLEILTNSEMGAFVVDRRRVYPLRLKEGKSLHYVNVANSDSDEVESHWKSKYLEEKIRADELARLLESTKQLLENSKKRSVSPILQNFLPGTKSDQTEKQQPIEINRNSVYEQNNVEPQQKKTVKIKFTKDKEIELEGNWSQMEPMVEKMVRILNKPEDCETKPETTERGNQNGDVEDHKSRGSIQSSGRSTPSTPIIAIDEEVHDKVNQIEGEIFKKIEEIEKEEGALSAHDENKNVTKRKRGRPKKLPSISSVTSLENSIKKPKTSNANQQTTTSAIKPVEGHKPSTSKAQSDVENVGKRKKMPPRKYDSDTTNAQTLRETKSTGKLEVIIPEDEPNVLYKFPRSRSQVRTRDKKSEQSSTYSTKEPAIFVSPDSKFSESTQGYQDSDISPPKLVVKRRKSYIAKKNSGKYIRKTVEPYLADVDTGESNTSNIASAQKCLPTSSPNSEIYQSESYQVLMPKARDFKKLEKIDEASRIQVAVNIQNAPNKENTNIQALSPLSIEIDDFYLPSRESEANTGSLGNSSNVSFPLSPELSVVENLSLVKELISDSTGDHPTLNETHGRNMDDPPASSKYLISDIDISVPLMAQPCELTQKRARSVSESLLHKIDSVNMNEPTLSDSLDRRLQNLLLESAKKLKQVSEQDNLMEVDLPTDKQLAIQSQPVRGKRKRSSTPRKSKKTQKSKQPDVETVAEHQASCSRGRISCPPVINVIDCETTAANAENKKKAEKKKDVIKVKIQRPKRSHSSGRISVCTDSGINQTGSGMFLQDCNYFDDSVDLIHNHSDTCLQTNECTSNSVEFIENSAKSIITVDDSASMVETAKTKDTSYEFVTPELLNDDDARDPSILKRVVQPLTHFGSDTPHHSPAESLNSLITEDLSDESPVRSTQSKWYLLSEDESRTNFFDARSQNSNDSIIRSHITQLFPVTCAVPNLSTITEASKDNDIKKPVLDSDVDTQSNTQVFDSK